jgi:hypothetical protein
MFIKITRSTYLSGQPAAVGEVFEVDEQTAKQSVAANKAVIVEAPAEAIVEPAKPKVKKVSATAPKEE